MNSMPNSSAMRAKRRQSGQLPDQRSAVSVTARPDEQLAPNSPNFSRLRLPICVRSACVTVPGILTSQRITLLSKAAAHLHEVIPEIDIWRAAQLMLKRHGDKALEGS